MRERASGRWPDDPFARCAVGGRASQSLAVPSTYSDLEGHPSASSESHIVSLLHATREIQGRRLTTTYTDADQDHLDVTEHLRDAEEDVEQNRHELRETRTSHALEALH